MKLIYIVERFISVRMYNSFFVDYLKQRGFSVELWSIAPLQSFQLPESIKKSLVDQKLFRDKKSLLKNIQQLDAGNTYIIAFFPYTPSTWFIYRAISKKHIPFCFIANDIHPRNVSAKEQTYRSFLLRIRSLSLSQMKNFLVRKFFYKIPPSLLGVHAANKVFWGGKKSEIPLALVDKTTIPVRAHVVDYDRYNKLVRDKMAEKASPYLLFIEEDIFASPDYFYDKTKTTLTPEKYYGALRRFFDKLEKKLSMPIIIALHPTQEEPEIVKSLGNRPCFKGKTAELVKNSQLVLLFSSLSVAYAVLFEKPLLFLITDQIRQSFARSHDIDSMAQELEKKPINIDHEDPLDQDLFAMNKARYQRYKENFIKQSNTREASFQEILADEILGS